MDSELGIDASGDELLELLVTDLSLARAFHAGIPTARLLARVRLSRDRWDSEQMAALASPPLASSWDQLLAVLLAGAGASTTSRVKRAIARHARAAGDEGPLTAPEPVIAALVLAVATETDADASPAEAFSNGTEPPPWLARACAAYDPRLLSGDRRTAIFEACVRLATQKAIGPWPCERVLLAARRLRESELHVDILRRSSASLLPLDIEPPPASRRMALLERAELDALLSRDVRELASAVARIERKHERLPLFFDQLLADLTKLLSRRGALVLTTVPSRLPVQELAPPSIPSVRPVSWLPMSWSSPDAASLLASALERGHMTVPRVRSILARGGDLALDAIGAEMLRVSEHPFASAAFAEVLARSGRTRDVMRLVTYFAVAPDPSRAASALAACSSPELPHVLYAWLTSMLPNDGALAPRGDDPETSSAARLSACITALRPFPHLYASVRPLLDRVTDGAPSVSA